MRPYKEYDIFGNKHLLFKGDFMEVAKTLPPKSQHLIIADPPYFEIKGDFDFIWASFEDYLKDVEKWAIELKRILADNGTLFWWGHAKKIAYSQVILDKYFNLENNLKWEKIECQTKRQDFEQSRCFAPVTEHCLMYSLEEEETTGKHYEKIKHYFWKEYDESGLTLKKANELMGLATTGANLAGELFGRNRDRFCFPTKEKYECLQSSGYFRKEYEELRKEYEELRKEYEELRRPFNNYAKFTDVLKFSQEANITKNYDHPTQKPPKITRALIKTCSKEGQNMFVPFGGSGVDFVEGVNNKLKVIVCEMEEKHCITIDKRIEAETQQQSLF